MCGGRSKLDLVPRASRHSERGRGMSLDGGLCWRTECLAGQVAARGFRSDHGGWCRGFGAGGGLIRVL